MYQDVEVYLTWTRLPVPSLWLDVFQKMKSAGFTGVSFYVDWALLEGKPGDFGAKGVFALEPFFDAAAKAGIYLLAVGLDDNSCLKLTF
jgi:beta-galactosidase GanA